MGSEMCIRDRSSWLEAVVPARSSRLQLRQTSLVGMQSWQHSWLQMLHDQRLPNRWAMFASDIALAYGSSHVDIRLSKDGDVDGGADSDDDGDDGVGRDDEDDDDDGGSGDEDDAGDDPDTTHS